MTKVVAFLVAVAVLSAAATGVLIWQLSSDHGPGHPEISAYTRGQLVRVEPYRYCDVFDITKCDGTGVSARLRVSPTDKIQVSLPEGIARAPWVLLRSYEDGGPEQVEEFTPNSRLAVTIPPVDSRRGKLTGFAVMLPTLVRDQDGNEFPWPHAEWSVSTVWS